MSGFFAPISNVESRTRAAAAAAQQYSRQNPITRSGQGSFLGSIFGAAGPAASMSYGYATTTGRVYTILFYCALAALIIFLLLLAINYTIYPIFSFSSNDGGLIPIPTASDRKISYMIGPATYDLSANFPGIPACSYTLGMDVHVSGNFMASTMPRVILYRDTSANTSANGTVDTLPATYPNTNIIVWLDPVKNDLFVSAVTSASGSSAGPILETAGPIENIPIRKVFRLAIVFAAQFLEVYINGKLEKSLALHNPLATVADNTQLYPTILPMQQNVTIGNLTMWPRVLTAREIGRNESAPIKTETFFFNA